MLKIFPNGKIEVKAGHFKGPDVPEFELRRMVFEAPGGLAIDQNFFNEVRTAKDNIFNVIRIEEDFDAVLLSYLEFERELINYSLEHMLFHDLDYFGFQGQRNNINRRLGATLSAIRAYIDHTDRVLCKMFDQNGRIRQEFMRLKSTHYDEHFEYRAMENFRNYSQHCDVLIHSLTHHLKWVGEGENSVLEYSIEPKIVPQYLLNEKDKIKMYRTRLFGHKFDMTSCRDSDLMRRPHFCRGGVSVLFQYPATVVGGDKRRYYLTQFVEVLKNPTMDGLLFEGSEEPLCNSIGFGLSDESEACGYPPALDLLLKSI